MLNYNEVKERTYIIHDDQPWEVITSQVSRKQANKPTNKTKLKNMVTGQVVEHSFQVSDKVEEADITRGTLTYLYMKPGRGGESDEYWFCADGNRSQRIQLEPAIIGDALRFVKENNEVDALYIDKGLDEEQILGIEPPVKVELKVTEAPPNIKGDTATGGNKVVTLETGATVTVPMFINTGDVIRIKTESGEYSERVEKA